MSRASVIILLVVVIRLRASSLVRPSANRGHRSIGSGSHPFLCACRGNGVARGRPRRCRGGSAMDVHPGDHPQGAHSRALLVDPGVAPRSSPYQLLRHGRGYGGGGLGDLPSATDISAIRPGHDRHGGADRDRSGNPGFGNWLAARVSHC